MADRVTPPFLTVFDDNGDPLSGALLYVYLTGTTTPTNSYSDRTLVTPNSNPVVADSAGRFSDIWLDPAVTYKLVLKTSAGVTRWTADPVTTAGSVSEASQAEVDARTSTSKFVSPAKIANGIGLQGSSIASAAALTIPSVGDYFTVTGTTTITSISTLTAGREVTLYFSGSLQMTHNATTLILPAGLNILTQAGDVARFRSEGSGNWRLVNYRGAGLPRGGMVAQTGTTLDVVSTAAATTLFLAVVPANTLGTAGRLVLELEGDYLNNSGGNSNFTVDVLFGGSTFASTGAVAQAANANRRSFTVRVYIGAKGATNSQFGISEIVLGNAGGDAGGASAPASSVRQGVVGAEDTTAAKNFAIQVTHGTSAATISCRLHHAQVRIE